jgi:hypothetical protein
MVTLNIPLKLVSANTGQSHWSKRHKTAKVQKALVTYYLKTFDVERPAYFPVHVTLTRFAPREYDNDNLQTAFKHVRDAVSEYVLQCNIPGRADGDSRIIWDYRQEKTVDSHYFISVQIEQTSPID